MSLIVYDKTYATVEQQIAHWQSKGLIINHFESACDKVSQIGYERLRIYMLSRRDSSHADKRFEPDITLEDIISLYECDAKLRAICFQALGQFELRFRNAFTESLSQRFGSHPYENIEAFKNTQARIEVTDCFWKVYSKSKDPRAKHYKETYSKPSLPSIWTLKEFLTFGASARVFQGLSGEIQNEVSRYFNIVSDEVFKSWLVAMVDFRNICAHHDRLFNRRFQKAPSRLRRQNVPYEHTRHDSLKGLIECLVYLTQNDHLLDQVQDILTSCPAICMTETGF